MFYDVAARPKEMQSLLGPETIVKVSSTLDKSVGKKNLTDGSPETCWTSQQGTPQYIQITFASPVIPSQLSLTFQGGFVGIKCSVLVALPSGNGRKPTWERWTTVYPEDVNRAQEFDLAPQAQVQEGIEGMRLEFEESSDFFGRITVYDLQIRGSELNGIKKVS